MLRIWHGQHFGPCDRTADSSDCSHKVCCHQHLMKGRKCKGKPAAPTHNTETKTNTRREMTVHQTWIREWSPDKSMAEKPGQTGCDLILCYPSWTEEHQGLSLSRAALYWGSGLLGFSVLGTIHPLSPLPPTLSANTPDYLGWSTHLPSLTITFPPRSESLGSISNQQSRHRLDKGGKRHGKEPGGFLINHKTQGHTKCRMRNQHWDLLAKAESPSLLCLAGSCGFLSPGSCRYAAKPRSGLISLPDQLGAAHTSPTRSSALPANAAAALGESRQICRISATRTPQLFWKLCSLQEGSHEEAEPPPSWGH